MRLYNQWLILIQLKQSEYFFLPNKNVVVTFKTKKQMLLFLLKF